MSFSSSDFQSMTGNKSAAATSSRDVPKHRACDECRSRKLACSKEADGCARCKREGIPCYYSPQKPMGRPRKRRPADEPPRAPPASSRQRRAASPGIIQQRSRSTSSSSAPSVAAGAPYMLPSFQLSGAATPTPSLSDPTFGFLDGTATDMSFLDLLPAGCYQDGGLGLTTPAEQHQHVECGASSFHGTLPMDAYADLSFLDPVFASAAAADAQDATFGATPELSVGSHTPFNSEPSFSPPPQHHHARGVSTQQQQQQQQHPPLPSSKGYGSSSSSSSSSSEVLQPIPTVSCPCLSSLYMALESLANLPPDDIPAAMRVARHASRVARGVIACQVCSRDILDVSKPPPMQAFQNMMLLAALVPSACNAYTAIVKMIDHACNRASGRLRFSAREVGAGRWLPADLAGMDGAELEPREWRRVMLAIVRLDVHGEEKGSREDWGAEGDMGLSEVVAALDERNRRRHELVDASAAAGTLPPHTHYMMTPRSCKPEDRNCVRVLEVARMALKSLVIA